jgi:hypothetical protein
VVRELTIGAIQDEGSAVIRVAVDQDAAPGGALDRAIVARVRLLERSDLAVRRHECLDVEPNGQRHGLASFPGPSGEPHGHLVAVNRQKNRENMSGRIKGWKHILDALTFDYGDRVEAADP